MGPYGSLWVLLDPDMFCWILMDHEGSLWYLMGLLDPNRLLWIMKGNFQNIPSFEERILVNLADVLCGTIKYNFMYLELHGGNIYSKAKKKIEKLLGGEYKERQDRLGNGNGSVLMKIET
jgi:hypothetical protein